MLRRDYSIIPLPTVILERSEGSESEEKVTRKKAFSKGEKGDRLRWMRMLHRNYSKIPLPTVILAQSEERAARKKSLLQAGEGGPLAVDEDDLILMNI